MNQRKLLLLLLTLVTGLLPTEVLAFEYSAWEPPVNLHTVNSSADDFFGAISPGSTSLYFTSTRAGGTGGEDVYVAQRVCDCWECTAWGAPVNLTVVNSTANDRAPSISADGHWLYIASQRTPSCGLNDLHVSFREDTTDDFAWSTPVNLGCVVNTPQGDVGAAEDFSTGIPQIYFMSDRAGGLGNFDIWVSDQLADGSFAAATNVTALNSTAPDVRPFPRRDGLEMFLGSNRAGGSGNTDLWVSTREAPCDAWGTPTNLGSVVNSTVADSGPGISPDGTEMVFDSNRAGGHGLRDMYVTERENMDHQCRPRPNRPEQAEGQGIDLCPPRACILPEPAIIGQGYGMCGGN